MVTLVVILVAFAAAMRAYRYFSSRRGPHVTWRSGLAIGAVLGVCRATVACAGWYVMKHDGGPLQIPALALAMFAWPEASVLDTRRVAPAPAAFYATLAGVLIVSTSLAVSGVAVIAQRTRRRDVARTSWDPPDS